MDRVADSRQHRLAMTFKLPDRLPLSLAAAGRRAIREIDRRDGYDADDLLQAFVCAVWPSSLAQNQ